MTTSVRGQLSRRVRFVSAVVAAICLPYHLAAAQGCGTEHVVKQGETMAQIAAQVYGNPSQWTMIYYANQDRLGANASLLVPGLSLRLPCVGGAELAKPAADAAAQQPAPVIAGGSSSFIISQMVKRIEFLTADGYPPYTGRTLEGGGMLTQVVSLAMDQVKEESKGRFDYAISWVNDWASHLNPLLINRAFDVGFPWARPDCDNATNLDKTSQYRCEKFFFSDPLYEIVTSMFVRVDSRLKTLQTEEIAGISACRPTGYPLFEFDQNGRNWLKDGKITLMRPATVDECFRLLDKGDVDSVVMNELVGRVSINSLGIGERVRAIDQPMALTTLHMVIAKTHPQARVMLYYVNAALGKLRETGEYNRVVERQLNAYWQAQAAPSPAVGNVQAVKPATTTAPPPKPATSPPSASTAPTSTAKTEIPSKSP